MGKVIGCLPFQSAACYNLRHHTVQTHPRRNVMADQPLLPAIHVQVIPIEVFEPVSGEEGRVTRGPRDQVRKLTEAQMAVAFIVTEKLAGEAAAMLGRLHSQPGQVGLSGMEVEFGLGFNTELQVYVVGAKADASLHVKLTWKPDESA
jgi:hypothetical protein